MLRSAASKVMWVGRATVFMVGLSVILALLLGVASMALGADGQSFLLGERNVAQSLSTLVKQGTGPALSLEVDSGSPPLKVDSDKRVANLNADKLDGQNSTALLPGGDLPPGRTVRGNYEIDSDNTSGNGELAAGDSISFGYRLASEPTVEFVRVGAASTTNCPGTASSPEAAKGYLCIYEKAETNTYGNSPYYTNLTRVGVGLYAYSNTNGDVVVARGTWAVTAP